MNPSDLTKPSPAALASQLFKAALARFNGNALEASMDTIRLLTDALVFTIKASSGDNETACKGPSRQAVRVKITGDDCRSCGACCVGGFEDGEGWADCTEEDILRMSRHARDRLVPMRYSWNYTPAIGATPTRISDEFGKMCAFLRGTPGKRCSCSIYATRPAVCSSLKPGSAGCRAARAQLELPH
jgi:Fe-S-cluster containining protein